MRTTGAFIKNASLWLIWATAAIILEADVNGQAINKQLEAAKKSDRRLEWKATELYQRVLDHPDFKGLPLADKLIVCDSLAWLYYVQDDYSRSERPAIEAVKLREEGQQDPSVKAVDRVFVSNRSIWYTQALQNLAKTQLALGKYLQAQDSFRQALEAFEKFNHKPHESLKWELLIGLGRSYYRAGSVGKAIPLYGEAFDLKNSLFDTHVLNAEALGELANMMRDTGDQMKAEMSYIRAIKIMSSGVYGDKRIERWDTVRIENYLGYAEFLRQNGKVSEADAFENKAKVIQSSYQ